MSEIRRSVLQPPRGTRDFLPEEMIRRNRVLDIVTRVFESYGYDPLGTPAFENWELLKLKSGEDVINQIYYFKDKSGRELGLRFEMTASLARVVASKKDLVLPFKRYAIGPVWRYERPAPGRFREFYQADVDVVGSGSPRADSEVISVAVDCLKALGFKDLSIRLNDRRVLEGFMCIVGIPTDKILDVFRTLDKLEKIGTEEVSKALMSLGIEGDSIGRLLSLISMKGTPSEVLRDARTLLSGQDDGLKGCSSLEEILRDSEALGFSEFVTIDFSLARGLDYYTGPVFEIGLQGIGVGSLAGGGRYDQLIEVFGGKAVPATGVSLGIERIMTLLDQKGFFEPVKTKTELFVACASNAVRVHTEKIAKQIRDFGFRVDTDLLERNLRNQLEYVDKKGIGLAVIVGEKELSNGRLALKDMKKNEQTEVKIEDLEKELRARVSRME